MAVEQAFTWGGGGRKRTQDQIDMERKIAAALVAKGADFSPVGHWSQGLARVAQGVMGAVDERRADAAENENSAYNSEIIATLLGGDPASSPQASAALPATTGAGEELAATSPATDFSVDPTIKTGIADTASALGIDPVDLATAISYETGGTFDPVKGGPTTQWGQHKGLIQFGEPQAQRYGVDWTNPVGSQLGPDGAVAKYLRDTGVKPGMGLMDIYSAINAGGVGRYDRSDANNGGAPGTVADKVNQQMAAHRAKALALFPAQTAAATPQAAIEAVAPASGYVDPTVSAQGGAPAAIAAVAPQSVQPDAPALPPPVAIAPPPAVAALPQQQVAQALTAQPPQASSALNPAIIKALTDPRASPGTKAVAQILMQQEQAKAKAVQDQQTWLARQQYEQQQKASDPNFKLAQEKFAFERDQSARTSDIKEYEYAKGQGFTGSFAEFQQSMKKAGAANTTINTGEGSKFYNKLDEKNAETFSTLSEEGLRGRGKLAQIDRLEALMNNAPQGAVGALKQAAGEYGIKTEGLSDIQAASALINELVPQQRQPGSGTMSDADLALFKQSLPRIINQPGGNQLIFQTMRGIAGYQVKMGEIADAVANRDLTPQQGRDAIQKLENPLAQFKPPAGQNTPNEGWQELSPGVRVRKVN